MVSWKYSVGRGVAFIGAFMIGWGILGIVKIVKQDFADVIAISGAILLIGGLFFSLLGERKNSSQI